MDPAEHPAAPNATGVAARFEGRLSWYEAITTGHLMSARGAIGFAIIEILLSAKIIDGPGYSILAFVILANTIMAAWE